MTLIIENVKEEFLPAYRGLNKSFKVKMKTKKTQAELAQEYLKESKEMDELYKAGKLKTYKSMKEYRAYRGRQNDEI